MAFALQMDFFEEKPTELDVLKAELKAVKATLDKVRKGTYCEINKIRKMCVEDGARIDILERHICQKATTVQEDLWTM